MPKDFERYEIRRTKLRRRCSKCSKIMSKGTEYCRYIKRTGDSFKVETLCLACGYKSVDNAESCNSRIYRY